MRGAGGSSFLLYLLGITFGNPLPVHYYCPYCHKVKWGSDYPKDPPTTDAFDFNVDNNDVCPDDGTVLEADGHDIPWQTLFGYGDYKPHFGIDVPEHCYSEFSEKLKDHWIFQYAETKPQPPDNELPLRYYLSKITLLFIIEKQEVDACFYEKNITARNWLDQYLDMGLDLEEFLSACFFALEAYEPEIPVGTSFSDIIAYSGLIRSTGAWNKKTAFLVKEFHYPLISMPCFKEDIFNYYLSHGYSEEDAWKATKYWPTMGSLYPPITVEQLTSKDWWMLELRMDDIKYLFPKAHIVERVLFQLRALNKSTYYWITQQRTTLC